MTRSPCQAWLQVSSLLIILNGSNHLTPSLVVGLSQHRVAEMAGTGRKNKNLTQISNECLTAMSFIVAKTDQRIAGEIQSAIAPTIHDRNLTRCRELSVRVTVRIDGGLWDKERQRGLNDSCPETFNPSRIPSRPS